MKGARWRAEVEGDMVKGVEEDGVGKDGEGGKVKGGGGVLLVSVI